MCSVLYWTTWRRSGHSTSRYVDGSQTNTGLRSYNVTLDTPFTIVRLYGAKTFLKCISMHLSLPTWFLNTQNIHLHPCLYITLDNLVKGHVATQLCRELHSQAAQNKLAVRTNVRSSVSSLPASVQWVWRTWVETPSLHLLPSLGCG